MKNFLSNPDPDGCGPYGRHLTGAVDWQKMYRVGIGTSTVAMVAGSDYLSAVPPPSESITVNAIEFCIQAAGDATAKIRAALYDMETFPAGTLLQETAEAPANAVACITAAIAPVRLRKNGRYAVLLCANAVAYPSLYAAHNLVHNWLGSQPGQPFYGMMSVRYTRAYGAFPAIYNGAFNVIEAFHHAISLRLP